MRRAAKQNEISWDPARGVLDPADLEGLDAIVHLAGDSVARRWNAQRKDAILRSRVDGLRLLRSAMKAGADGPRLLIAASAIGWYGPDRADEELDEIERPRWRLPRRRLSRRRRGATGGLGRRHPGRSDAPRHRPPPRGGALRRLLWRRASASLDRSARASAGGAGSTSRTCSASSSTSSTRPRRPGQHRLAHAGTAGEFARTLGRVLRRPAFLPCRSAVNATLRRDGPRGAAGLPAVAAGEARRGRLQFPPTRTRASLRAMLGRARATLTT